MNILYLDKAFPGILDAFREAEATSIALDRERLSLSIEAASREYYSDSEISRGEAALKKAFCLNEAIIRISYILPTPTDTSAEDKPKKAEKDPNAPKKERDKGPKPDDDKIILGKACSFVPMPIKDALRAEGDVCVWGKVFSDESREIPKNEAELMAFFLGDSSGAIAVSKYFSKDDANLGTYKKVKDGMYLKIQGSIKPSKYNGEMTMNPKSIEISSRPPIREDKAERKRSELHLHTRFSTMDALTDVGAAIKRAEAWGHPAIAITDHGSAQGFPDAWKVAPGAKTKVIYGMEGYLINDVDERLAVHGKCSLPLDAEFVAFDVETTGLHPNRDRLTEIGAVIFKNGELKETFGTFVNPEMPIPPNIVELTGIHDSDVMNAPGEAEALKAFMEFCGDRPVFAHNADFDIGFLHAAAERNGIEFAPVYCDSLVIAQALLPELKRYKLDIVSSFLGLPDFNHHRAYDDAAVVARIMGKFFPMLRERGVNTLGEIDAVLSESREGVIKNQRPKHIIILVKNPVGKKNLYELISESYLKNFHRNPLVLKSSIIKRREGLIIGSACESGELFRSMVRGAGDEELCRIAEFYDYLEIQPICNNRFLIAEGKAENDDELREFNLRIARIAEKLGKPLVATGDVHFLDPEDEILRHILLAGKKFADADKELPIYFKTTDEMLEEFAYLGPELCEAAVIDNPNAIAMQCEDIELLPKGQLFAPVIENSDTELRDLVYGKMHELYGETPPPIVQERVDTELNTILDHHYDVIYMSAQKLVQNSIEHGYLVGSRGSVGSSIVAFMSGITEVNSLPAHYRCPKCKYTDFESGKGFGCGADMADKVCPVCGEMLAKDGFDIPFETFLGFPGSAKTPDIDLNFSGEYQGKAHKYTEELFGSDHVFRAGTIGALADKTAYGYVKKYFEERNVTASEAEIMRLALGCVGVKRTTGQHPGGLVVIPQDMDVTDFCPVQHPADDPDSDIITTHFEYHCMEDNLLKLDELGHDDPTMIKMLEDMTGVNARLIPLDDPETMGIFKSPAPLGLPDTDPIVGKTGTIGIPEFGTGFTRQMLVDTQPEGFDVLVRLSGFSHGTDVWLGNARDLITSGTATVSETVGCRDDIMLYLISMGMESKLAFKIMEAVRKGKVKKGGFSEGWEEKMKELGVPEWYIGSLAKIAYLFPRAHAVAYVMMAFRIAWFKVHMPLQFYAAYFYRRSEKDGFDADSMIKGIGPVRAKIKEINDNPKPTAKEQDLLTTLEAVYEFYLRGFSFAQMDLYESDSRKFLVVGDKQLRPPFVSISGLGDAAAEDLGKCGDLGEKFLSIDELKAACPKLQQSHIDSLKELGVLSGLPESNQISLFDGFFG